MVCHVTGTIARAIAILGALALTSPAFAMGKGGGGGKPPKDDLMGEAAIVVSAGRNSIAEVQVFDVNGNGPQVVVKGNKDEFFWEPVWAPDGLHVAILTDDLVGCRRSIRITTFDEVSGEWSIPETIVCAGSARNLDWDPSSEFASQRIYFRADPLPDDEEFQKALAVVEFSLDLNNENTNLDFPSGMADDNLWTLAVSPDGYTIAVTRVDLDFPLPLDRTDIALFDVFSRTYTTLIDMVVTTCRSVGHRQLERALLWGAIATATAATCCQAGSNQTQTRPAQGLGRPESMQVAHTLPF